MKKILSATCAMMLASAGMMANAQQEQTQLPNFGFEDWEACEGQADNAGSSYAMSGSYNVRPGSEPLNWNGSSVNQMGQEKILVSNIDGAVQLQNLFVGLAWGSFKIGSTAPGYLTLGTPWVYAETNVKNCDGGTFGGVEFKSKPDAIKGRFKRTDTNDENSYIIAYLWNGDFTSNIGSVDLKTSEEKSNVDRAILGKVTPNEDSNGRLVASCEQTFKPTNDSWQEIEVPLTYVEGAGDPTMMNVIISAGDYWNRGDLKENTTLLVDDVEFVYYSRLASISLNEEAITLEEGKYDYTVRKPLNFSEEDVEYTLEGESQSANVSVSVDTEKALVTVTVSNEYGTDTDGKSSHTYTFKYQKPEVEPVIEEYDGYLNVEMLGSTVVENTQSKIEIQDYQNGYCTFLLPNLIITIGDSTLPLGDIRIDNVKIETVGGGNSYTGTVEDMALLGGAIHAKVELNGTIIGSDVKMNVDVIWYQDYPTNEVETPIKVSFTSAKLSGVESVAGDGVKVYAAVGCVVVEGAEGVAQVYTVDGKQVAVEAVNGKTEIALANGLYIVRVGNKVQKVVVK